MRGLPTGSVTNTASARFSIRTPDGSPRSGKSIGMGVEPKRRDPLDYRKGLRRSGFALDKVPLALENRRQDTCRVEGTVVLHESPRRRDERDSAAVEMNLLLLLEDNLPCEEPAGRRVIRERVTRLELATSTLARLHSAMVKLDMLPKCCQLFDR